MERISSTIYKTKISTGIVGIVLLLLLYGLPNLLYLAGYSVFRVTSLQGLIFQEIYTWMILAVMFAFAFYIEKQPFRPWEDTYYPYRWYVRSFFRLIILLFLLVWTVHLMVQFLGITDHSKIIGKLKPILHAYKPLVLILSFTAGVTEELLVRGYLFSRLEQLFKNPKITILVTAAIFSLLHISYGTLTNMLFPLLLGILFSAHYYKYRNIKVLIMCHFFWDLLSLGLNAR